MDVSDARSLTGSYLHEVEGISIETCSLICALLLLARLESTPSSQGKSGRHITSASIERI